jgi:hypothetical protein
MRRKLLFGNSFMGLMILFAIFFQSFHAFEHLVKQFSEKHCHHVYHEHKTELNHGHDGLEKCFTCEFAFSNSLKSDFLTFSFYKNEVLKSYTLFQSREITSFFCGSLFALRAPPNDIV